MKTVRTFLLDLIEDGDKSFIMEGDAVQVSKYIEQNPSSEGDFYILTEVQKVVEPAKEKSPEPVKVEQSAKTATK